MPISTKPFLPTTPKHPNIVPFAAEATECVPTSGSGRAARSDTHSGRILQGRLSGGPAFCIVPVPVVGPASGGPARTIRSASVGPAPSAGQSFMLISPRRAGSPRRGIGHKKHKRAQKSTKKIRAAFCERGSSAGAQCPNLDFCQTLAIPYIRGPTSGGR